MPWKIQHSSTSGTRTWIFRPLFEPEFYAGLSEKSNVRKHHTTKDLSCYFTTNVLWCLRTFDGQDFFGSYIWLLFVSKFWISIPASHNNVLERKIIISPLTGVHKFGKHLPLRAALARGDNRGVGNSNLPLSLSFSERLLRGEVYQLAIFLNFRAKIFIVLHIKSYMVL